MEGYCITIPKPRRKVIPYLGFFVNTMGTKWLSKWSPVTTTSIILSSNIVKVFPQMVGSLHDWWWRKVFPNNLFKRIHGSVGHLKQTMCCMHVWNDQNFKTFRDAKNLRKDDGCFQNGMEDWKRSVWVGGSSPFFVDNDLLTA